MRLVVQLCFVLSLVVVVQGDFNYPYTTDGGDFEYTGASGVELDRIRLIDNDRYDAGAFYYETKQIVDESFVITFTYAFDWSDIPGDGLALVIQNHSPTALSGGGGSLGARFPCIYMELDTFQNLRNPEAGSDGSDNEISFQYAGSPFPNNAPEATNSIGSITPNFDIAEDEVLITLQVEYDHDLGVFSVFRVLDATKTFLLATQQGYKIDEMLILDQGTAWIGFTSTTGYYTAAAYIYEFKFVSSVGIGLFIICPHDLVVTANPNTCTYTGTTGTPSIINVDRTATSSFTKSPRSPYPPGTTRITYTAFSTNLSTATCQQTLVVQPHPSCTSS